MIFVLTACNAYPFGPLSDSIGGQRAQAYVRRVSPMRVLILIFIII